MGRILHHHAPDASFRYLLRKNPVGQNRLQANAARTQVRRNMITKVLPLYYSKVIENSVAAADALERAAISPGLAINISGEYRWRMDRGIAVNAIKPKDRLRSLSQGASTSAQFVREHLLPLRKTACSAHCLP